MFRTSDGLGQSIVRVHVMRALEESLIKKKIFMKRSSGPKNGNVKDMETEIELVLKMELI